MTNLENKMVKVVYGLSEAGRKENILRGGNGKEIQYINIPANEQLIRLSKVDSEGNVVLVVAIPTWGIMKEYTHDLSRVVTVNNSTPHYHYTCYSSEKDRYGKIIEYKLTLFDTTQTIESILKLYEEAEEKKAELLVELEKINAQEIVEIQKQKEAKAIREEEEKRLKEERAAKEQSEKEGRAIEKSNWINKYGSQYLKDCLELGQYAHKEYILERAKFEFPEFEIDYNNDANWEQKYSPSQTALDMLKELRKTCKLCDVVWLTRDVYGKRIYDKDENPSGHEAIAISGFLGKYDLIKTAKKQGLQKKNILNNLKNV
jgi:hypothetical protein